MESQWYLESLRKNDSCLNLSNSTLNCCLLIQSGCDPEDGSPWGWGGCAVQGPLTGQHDRSFTATNRSAVSRLIPRNEDET